MGSKGGSNLGINITDKCNRAHMQRPLEVPLEVPDG